MTRMIAAGISLPIVAKILGWSAGTMAKMTARYGHFVIEELRGAADAIGRVGIERPRVEVGTPEFPPEGKASSESSCTN